MASNNNQNLIFRNNNDGPNLKVFPEIITVAHASDSTDIVYEPSQLLGGMVLRYHPGANDTLPSGSDIIQTLSDPPVGEAFDFYIRNMTTSDISLASGVGSTLDNSPSSIGIFQGQKYKGIITGAGTVDVYPLGLLDN